MAKDCEELRQTAADHEKVNRKKSAGNKLQGFCDVQIVVSMQAIFFPAHLPMASADRFVWLMLDLQQPMLGFLPPPPCQP